MSSTPSRPVLDATIQHADREAIPPKAVLPPHSSFLGSAWLSSHGASQPAPKQARTARPEVQVVLPLVRRNVRARPTLHSTAVEHGAQASGVHHEPFAHFKQLVEAFEALRDGAHTLIVTRLLHKLACFLDTPMATPSSLAAIQVVLLMRMFTSSYPSFEKACCDANVSTALFNTWHCRIPMLAQEQMIALRSGRAIAILSPSDAALSLARVVLPNALPSGYVLPRGMCLLAYVAERRPRLLEHSAYTESVGGLVRTFVCSSVGCAFHTKLLTVMEAHVVSKHDPESVSSAQGQGLPLLLRALHSLAELPCAE